MNPFHRLSQRIVLSAELKCIRTSSIIWFARLADGLTMSKTLKVLSTEWSPVNLTKEDSSRITERFRKFGIPVKDNLEKIEFHPDFKKGMQYAVCKSCGYIQPFQGLWEYPCEMCNKNVKIYGAAEDAIEAHRNAKVWNTYLEKK